MKVLFIGGVFSKACQKEIEADAKRAVEYSANVFQEKLLEGFRGNSVEPTVISAPFIGAYPQYSKTIRFKGFESDDGLYRYVAFNNVWGIRNVSRERALKRAVDDYLKTIGDEEDLLVVAYSPHTPIIAAALHAKDAHRNCRLCAVIPDLPQYTNLEKGSKPLYTLLKGGDSKRFGEMIVQFEHVIVLTKQMGEALGLRDGQFDVVEGILRSDFAYADCEPIDSADNEIRIVYTGKLYEKFGALDLAASLAYIEDPNVRLILCGTGDCMSQLEEMAASDDRIRLTGQVSPEEALALQRSATILVNPRSNHSEFAKYSFPSKNLEYLATGKPVVCYMLDGMPEVYEGFVYPISQAGSPAEAIANAIKDVLQSDREARLRKYDAFYSYSTVRLLPKQIAALIESETVRGDKRE